MSTVLMGESGNQERRTHAKEPDYEDNSLHGRQSWVTGDDAGLLVEICVGLFIALASALALFLIVYLFTLLARLLLYVWLYFASS